MERKVPLESTSSWWASQTQQVTNLSCLPSGLPTTWHCQTATPGVLLMNKRPFKWVRTEEEVKISPRIGCNRLLNTMSQIYKQFSARAVMKTPLVHAFGMLDISKEWSCIVLAAVSYLRAHNVTDHQSWYGAGSFPTSNWNWLMGVGWRRRKGTQSPQLSSRTARCYQLISVIFWHLIYIR